jgi:hypothetical protein
MPFTSFIPAKGFDWQWLSLYPIWSHFASVCKMDEGLLCISPGDLEFGFLLLLV